MEDNTDTREVPAATPWDQPPPSGGSAWGSPPPAPPAPQVRPGRPPKRGSRLGLVLLILGLAGLMGVAVILLVVLVIVSGAGAYAGPGLAGYQQYTAEEGSGRDRILLVDVEGVIASGEGCAPLVMAQLRHLHDNCESERFKVVLLRVNSPGGTVTACDKIDNAVRKCIEKGIPFVAYYDEVAASGGYYVSARANPIIAQPTCIVGSIGVIGLNLNIQKMLSEKLGIEAQAIKSVPYKDVPSLFRPMTEEERAYMQKMIDAYHARFVGIVGSGRKLKPEEVSAFADGRVFLSEEARALRMIDQVGDWQDAVQAARQIAGQDAPVIGYRRKPSTLEMMFESRSGYELPEELRLKLKVAAEQRFCYLWLP